MLSQRKSWRANERARGSTHFTEFEANELKRNFAQLSRGSSSDMQNIKSTSYSKNMPGDSNSNNINNNTAYMFAPAFFYEPVITNTTMRLSVSQNSRPASRPFSHQPMSSRESAERLVSPSPSPSSSSLSSMFAETEKVIHGSSNQNIARVVTTGKKSSKRHTVTSALSSTAAAAAAATINTTTTSATSPFSSSLLTTNASIQVKKSEVEENKEVKSNTSNANNFTNNNNVSKPLNNTNITDVNSSDVTHKNTSDTKMWQSAPERPLSRSNFSLSECKVSRKSLHTKSRITMEELRSVTSRVRTFPESALNVIYRFLLSLGEEVMTLSFQEAMKSSENKTLLTLIHNYCALDNNNKNETISGKLTSSQHTSCQEPGLSLTVSQLNTHNSELPPILSEQQIDEEHNIHEDKACSVNTNTYSYSTNNNNNNRSYASRNSLFVNRLERLRFDSSVIRESSLRESSVRTDSNELDKVNFYLSLHSFPIYEQNNKLQYSHEWFETLDARSGKKNETCQHEEQEEEEEEEEELDYFNEDFNTSRARVTISSEPPLYISGMLFDPENEKFLFNGCPFSEEARLLRVSANAELSPLQNNMNSTRNCDNTSKPCTLLLREYLTMYVPSSTVSTTTKNNSNNNNDKVSHANTRTGKSPLSHEESRREESEQEEEQRQEEKEEEQEEEQEQECEKEYSYLVQTFSIVPSTCPIVAATHRTELLSPEIVSAILPYVYGGALTRVLTLNPEAFTEQTHSALARRSFAGSMRLNSTLIQDLLSLRKSNSLNSLSHTRLDAQKNVMQSCIEIAPSTLSLHETLILLTRLDPKIGSATRDSKNVCKQELYSPSSSSIMCKTNVETIPSSTNQVSSSSHHSSSSTRTMDNSLHTLAETNKFCEESELKLWRLREEKITSAKQASVRNWEAYQDPLQLVPQVETIHSFLQWYTSRCDLLLRIHATVLATHIIQHFTRKCLARKRRALHRMCMLWDELEKEAERVMRQHRPAPSSTARIEVVASLVLQEHMITTREYKEELIEQIWMERKHMAYNWQREFSRSHHSYTNTNSIIRSNNSSKNLNINNNNNNICNTSYSSSRYMNFVESILSRVSTSEKTSIEEILLCDEYGIPLSDAEMKKSEKLMRDKVCVAIRPLVHRRDCVNTNQEAISWNSNSHDTNNNDDKNDDSVANNKKKKITQIYSNNKNSFNKSTMVKVTSNRAMNKVQVCHAGNNKKYAISQLEEEEEEEYIVHKRSARSCKLLNAFTMNSIHDRRVADEIHNLFGWYIEPEELLYQSHQRLFGTLQSTVLTLEEAQMATERHLLESLYHSRHELDREC